MSGEGGGGGEKTVPQSVYNELVAERDEFKRQLSAAQKEAKDLREKAATADTLASQLQEAKEGWKADESKWTSRLALAEAGITDPAGRKVAQLFYEELDAKDRPPIGDWLKSLKAEGAEVPMGLQPYLGQPPGSAGGDASSGNGDGGPKGSDTEGGTRGGKGPSASTYSAEHFKQMRERAMRTNNWSEYEKAREEMLANRS